MKSGFRSSEWWLKVLAICCLAWLAASGNADFETTATIGVLAGAYGQQRYRLKRK